MLSLIEENTAAALHYGIDRVFEEPNTVIYYNMGASAVQVSIATYSSYQVVHHNTARQCRAAHSTTSHYVLYSNNYFLSSPLIVISLSFFLLLLLLVFQIKEAGKNKSIGQFEVVGKAWDASLGGFAFDVRLAGVYINQYTQYPYIQYIPHPSVAQYPHHNAIITFR